jgi:DNA invertase Pin-like site-specific DNA recombinase
MTALLIGYARCSTDQQDLTAQHDGLVALGVAANRIYVDHGLTGTNRERPGLREALAACREGDTLVVTKLDRLARSLPDARAIADELTAGQVRLNWADRYTTRRTRSVGCISTCSPCSPNRVRPDLPAHPGGHEGRQGQRASAW